jgi:hypothetical protein
MDSIRNWGKEPTLVYIDCEIALCRRRKEITCIRAGLFMTAHPHGTCDSAARHSAVVVIAASRVPRKTKGKRRILFLPTEESAFYTTQTGLCPKNALPRPNPASRNALRQLTARRLFILNLF